MFKLPTYEEAMEIVNSCEDDIFFVDRGEVDGYEYAFFNYRMACYKDFEDVDNRRLEMRGLCFIKNGETWVQHIALHKFFNHGENESTHLDLIKDKKIVAIADKLDGSIIMPVMLPNGRVRMKSKMSFESEQAVMAQKVYDESTQLQEFIRRCSGENNMPIFELTSPFNQIVLNYETTNVSLLQLRCGKTGEYFNNIADIANTYGIPNASQKHYSGGTFGTGYKENINIKTLIDAATELEEVEGWVVQFEDGQFVKVKTQWYCEMHHLVGYDATRENVLIRTILEDRIDDALSMLGPCERKTHMENMHTIVTTYFRGALNRCNVMRNEYLDEMNADRKTFAIKYVKHPLFPVAVRNLDCGEDEMETTLKEFILKKTSKLFEAKSFVEMMKEQI